MGQVDEARYPESEPKKTSYSDNGNDGRERGESNAKQRLNGKAAPRCWSFVTETPVDEDGHTSSMPFYTGVLAIVTAGTAVILVALAVLEHTGLNAGLDLISYLSRRHYVVQITGFFALIHAIVSHRVYQGLGRKICKRIHGMSHVACLCLLVSGIAIRVIAKNQDVNSAGTYEPNLYTMHSFLAICSLTVYLPNIIISFFIYRTQRSHSALNIFIEPHREIGKAILAAFTAVVSAGLQQLFTRGGKCMPTRMTTPNTNPAAVYSTMGAGCRLINGAGILIYLACILAALSVSLSVTRLGRVFELMDAADEKERHKKDHPDVPLNSFAI